jgi:hypothetical protein
LSLNREPVNQDVTLKDQFSEGLVRVEQPVYFCNPVTKTHRDVTGDVTFPIEEPEVHHVLRNPRGKD